jgi:hypothetical protein
MAMGAPFSKSTSVAVSGRGRSCSQTHAGMSGGIGLTDPVEGWRQIPAELHREICEHGFNTEGNAFVQY